MPTKNKIEAFQEKMKELKRQRRREATIRNAEKRRKDKIKKKKKMYKEGVIRLDKEGEERPRKKPIGAICGAKKRTDGKICQAPAMENGRCRLHGGKNGGNPRADPKKAYMANITYGIYADVGLLDEEYPVYPSITGVLGTLDEEIHIARIKLRRCVKGQKAYEEAKDELARNSHEKGAWLRVARKYNVLSIDEIETQEGQVLVDNENANEDGSIGKHLENYTRDKIVRRVRDFTQETKKYINLIAKLEEKRKVLLEGNLGGEDYLRDLAISLRNYSVLALNTLPGAVTMGSGNYNDGKSTATETVTQ